MGADWITSRLQFGAQFGSPARVCDKLGTCKRRASLYLNGARVLRAPVQLIGMQISARVSARANAQTKKRPHEWAWRTWCARVGARGGADA